VRRYRTDGYEHWEEDFKDFTRVYTIRLPRYDDSRYLLMSKDLQADRITSLPSTFIGSYASMATARHKIRKCFEVLSENDG
jgi:hypothetical protein